MFGTKRFGGLPKWHRIGAMVIVTLGCAWGVAISTTRDARAGDPAATVGDGPVAVDFRRDVRPILSQHCFECHGPDGAARKGKLRLDTRDGALGDRRGGAAFVPGNVAASLAIERIREDHAEDRMPPPETDDPLTPSQVDTLVRWVEQGAPWEDHWAFVPPERPIPPATSNPQWVQQPLDAFVLARLDDEGLAPSPEADRRALARRVSLDLTGLPPTRDELHAFLFDDAPDAYDRMVDRYLASDRYGEHMARYWLDATRYGDTHGLHLDNVRSIWPYRDWVVRAFNDNMPFDQFTIEQLAGDLLEEPTLDQRIATGFVRCNVTTNEGGSIVEEVYVRNVVDRTETFGTIYLGMTAGCAACHDHKFDPISQREFYQLFAFFNSGTDNPMDGNRQDHAPVVKVPSPDQISKIDELTHEIAGKERFLAADRPELDDARATWEAEWSERLAGSWEVLETTKNVSKGGATLTVQPDGSVLASGKNPDRDSFEIEASTEMVDIIALQLETLTDPSLPAGGPSRVSHTNFVLNDLRVEAVSRIDPTKSEVIEFVAAWANYSQPKYHVSNAVDDDPKTGWAKLRRPSDHRALFFAKHPFGYEGGTDFRVRMAFDYGGQHVIGRYRLSVTGDRENQETHFGPWSTLGLIPTKAVDAAFAEDLGPEAEILATGTVDLAKVHRSGAKEKPTEHRWKRNPELIDGKVHALPGAIGATYLHRTVFVPDARDVTFTVGSDDGVKAWWNGRLVLDRKVNRGVALDQERFTVKAARGANELVLKISNHGGQHGFAFRKESEDVGGVPIDVASILAQPADQRTDEQRLQVRDHYYRTHEESWRTAEQALSQHREELKRVEAMLPVSLVMEEMAEPKPAFVLNRGEYDDRGDPVGRETPAVLPPFSEELPRDRLGLARWLLDPGHPLTARVAVNRYWQQLFGVGLVKTSEDFGSQGEWPSHPELLDWLATTFVDGGWDVKDLMRRMVLSATYRQSSVVSPELGARDPENRLLARGPRFRMDAEVIRDSMLELGGLLVEKRGGPGVKPYQPSGIWEAVGYTSSNTAKYAKDSGEALYRRTLYTFWKRTAPPPTLQLFDAPTREACTVRRSRTNTPTAALGLMNDVQFVEAARGFAERLLVETDGDDNARLGAAFEAATARVPTEQEAAVLRRTLEAHRARFAEDLDAAKRLIAVGESKADEKIDPRELAAWTLVTNMVLNLHEVITKG
ncbi:MAG: PSD1 and planctomycete cytochrome C domain-containing protein [Planctomycetota bacterium]